MLGFVILYLRKHNPFIYSLSINLLIAALISIAVIMLFGNKYMSRAAQCIFRGEWVLEI